MLKLVEFKDAHLRKLLGYILYLLYLLPDNLLIGLKNAHKVDLDDCFVEIVYKYFKTLYRPSIIWLDMVLMHVFLLSQSLSIDVKQLLNDSELFLANRALLVVLLQIINLGNALQYLK